MVELLQAASGPFHAVVVGSSEEKDWGEPGSIPPPLSLRRLICLPEASITDKKESLACRSSLSMREGKRRRKGRRGRKGEMGKKKEERGKKKESFSFSLLYPKRLPNLPLPRRSGDWNRKEASYAVRKITWTPLKWYVPLSWPTMLFRIALLYKKHYLSYSWDRLRKVCYFCTEDWTNQRE